MGVVRLREAVGGSGALHLALREISTRVSAAGEGLRVREVEHDGALRSPSPPLRSTSPHCKLGVPALRTRKQISATPEIWGEVKGCSSLRAFHMSGEL